MVPIITENESSEQEGGVKVEDGFIGTSSNNRQQDDETYNSLHDDYGDHDSNDNELEKPLLGSIYKKDNKTITQASNLSQYRTIECEEVQTVGREMSYRDPRTQQREGQENGPKSEIDGLQAWLTLTCVFLMNATTLGALKIYGLIFEEIVAQKYYNRTEASWPISTASTIQNLAGVLTPMLALKLSWRSIEILQTLLFILANVGAYFSTGLALDILCLGIIQGVAFSIRYNMNVLIDNEYFFKYRATAMGISLAGSTFGAFLLKPIISYVLDNSDNHFRNSYLVMGIIMSFNIVLNLFIRKPRDSIRPSTPDSQESFELDDEQQLGEGTSLLGSLGNLWKNPSIHCIWISQTIYFYISRTYTIFIVDYGVDSGFNTSDSRSLLTFWVYGEIMGRLLLGGFVDSKLMNLKLNIFLVNLLVGLNGFSLLLAPSIFNMNTMDSSSQTYIFWFFGLSVTLTAAFSSLINMMIIPFGQEYLGKKNVPWAYAMGSVVTSVFLLLRPILIGLSRDYYKSYRLLIMIMSSGPFVYALLFMLVEPLLKKQKLHLTINRNRDCGQV